MTKDEIFVLNIHNLKKTFFIFLNEYQKSNCFLKKKNICQNSSKTGLTPAFNMGTICNKISWQAIIFATLFDSNEIWKLFENFYIFTSKKTGFRRNYTRKQTWFLLCLPGEINSHAMQNRSLILVCVHLRYAINIFVLLLSTIPLAI